MRSVELLAKSWGGRTCHAGKQDKHELVAAECAEEADPEADGRSSVQPDREDGRADRGVVPEDVAEDLFRVFVPSSDLEHGSRRAACCKRRDKPLSRMAGARTSGSGRIRTESAEVVKGASSGAVRCKCPDTPTQLDVAFPAFSMRYSVAWLSGREGGRVGELSVKFPDLQAVHLASRLFRLPRSALLTVSDSTSLRASYSHAPPRMNAAVTVYLKCSSP